MTGARTLSLFDWPRNVRVEVACGSSAETAYGIRAPGLCLIFADRPPRFREEQNAFVLSGRMWPATRCVGRRFGWLSYEMPLERVAALLGWLHQHRSYAFEVDEGDDWLAAAWERRAPLDPRACVEAIAAAAVREAVL